MEFRYREAGSDGGECLMKASRLFAVGDLRTVSVEKPVPQGKELLVKIGACGICGSDIPRVFEHGTSSGVYPLIIGHEFAGTIVSVGEDADRSLVGKRGAFFPLIPDFSCPSCLNGRYAMCSHYDYMGSRRDGGFAEYCIVPSAWNFIESSNSSLDFDTLCMTEPACVAQHAVRKGNVSFGQNVLIFGAGPIGIMAARWCVTAGANVLLADIDAQKVSFAADHGSDCLNCMDDGFASQVSAYFHGGSPDVVIEGTGSSKALENAISLCRSAGCIVLLGNPAGDTRIPLKSHSMILRKELTVQGIWNSNYSPYPVNEWHHTVRMMDEGKFRCADLITHRVGLEELPKLISDIKSKTINICKAIYFNG